MQFEAYQNHKGVYIAKQLVKAKVDNQVALLDKYDLNTKKLAKINTKLKTIKGKKIEDIRTCLTILEGRMSRYYFKEYFTLVPRTLQPEKRIKRGAYDIYNNLINLGYEIVKGEVFKSVCYAHLSPYLGFLHSVQNSKMSLVYDLIEPFRCIIENFLVSYITKINFEDSIELIGKKSYNKNKLRAFLNHKEETKIIKAIYELLDKQIAHTRIKKFGSKCKISTAIKEEPIKLAQYIRDEKETYQSINIMKVI